MSGRTNPNARAVAELYRRYLRDAGSVGSGWREVFSRLDEEARQYLESLGRGAAPGGAPSEATPAVAAGAREAALDSVRALMLIRSYRVRGHLEADLDPLGLAAKQPHPELHPATYGFGEEDWDRPIYIHGVLGLESATLREIMHVLRRDYTGTIGLEYMHLQDPDQKAWIQKRMEGVLHHSKIKDEDRITILERLTAAESFEKFMDRKYTGTKRFGLEGGESALPALETIVRRAAAMGVREIVIGMAHRGRLNVLANLVQKPFAAVFHEFQGGASTPDEIGGSGDVKYHLGTSTDREIDGQTMHLALAPNPSHLEAIDAVVVGKVRSSQDQRGDSERCRVMGLLIHGDAACAAQGVLSETLQFTDLEGYTTGGIIHLIINNQIGFTTSPMAARSSPYPSDLAKGIQAPIVHVNGDDPEAVVQAAAFATEYRQIFRRDVVIDLFCYRRHGHNEGDEPAFTQPLMYKRIKTHPTTREIYAKRLIEQGVLSQDDADALVAGWLARLDEEFAAATDYTPSEADWLEGAWLGLEAAASDDWHPPETGVELATLREVGTALTNVPDGFNINRKITRQLGAKAEMFDSGIGIDWSTGEALAIGTLLLEGNRVRMSGEDSNRGTFSQRHASWIDQETETAYVPLNRIGEGQAQFEIIDSPLSEYGVLGFEYGYAIDEPRTLVLWEAQFGDFANGAQVIVDQFIAAGESKWLRMCGLVMLLPHGYEGQGPEHSSARLERFLQLCAEDNMQVVNCTTPANYFHVLRRQLHRKFRKPLIIMTPKSLLRHKRAVSKLEDFGPGTRFQRIIECERPCDPKEARRVVLCSGKVYYDLLKLHEQRDAREVQILRVEQLYPFAADELAEKLAPYAHCVLVWCQEEPRNMGAWSYIADRIAGAAERLGFSEPRPRYVGRAVSASPATGVYRRHEEEQERLVEEALTVTRTGEKEAK
jgi:2-oxoglutarate dehydrogenase E1 component